MSPRRPYDPGPATGAQIRKEPTRWTLVVVRDLPHPPQKVWRAITDPAHLREWAPFDADRSLDRPGDVTLSTVNAPVSTVQTSRITRAEEPKVLEYSWGPQDLRWELEATPTGTRLTLWHNIDRNFISMGAAGWHICLDVLNAHLAEDPIGRLVGTTALQFQPWHRLNAEYAAQFGVELPKWGATAVKETR